MTKRQRLELMWIGAENQARLEPQMLLENPEEGRKNAQETQNDICNSASLALFRG
jgi:hypothetical protein